MSGTKEGGQKAKLTNLAKYGDDWYARIGRKGGSVGGLKGFAINTNLAKEAGRKGGLKSKRGKSKRNKDGSIFHTEYYKNKHMVND